MDESSLPPGPFPLPMAGAAAVRVGPWQERDQTWHEFLSRAAKGDHDAFAALYDATSSLVYPLVLRIVGNRADAEEVTLDVYVQAWREARRFDAQRGAVRTWLVMIARSRALDRLRSREARHGREAGPVEEESRAPDPSPEELSSMSQSRRAVAEAMACLSPEQREVINLAYFDGMSQTEMAEFLSLPLGTVKTRVRLGMMRLRDLLGERRN